MWYSDEPFFTQIPIYRLDHYQLKCPTRAQTLNIIDSTQRPPTYITIGISKDTFDKSADS